MAKKTFNLFLIAFILYSVHAHLLSAVVYAQDDKQLKRQVDLELEEVEGATAYEVELTSKASGKTSNFKMKTPAWKASIRPGEFTLRLRSYDSRGVPGAWSEEMPFSVKLPGPELRAPTENAQIKTGEEKSHDTEFKWQAVPGTKKYRVEVTPEGSTTPVTETFSDNQGKINLPVATRYTWKVIPVSKSGEDGESQEKPGTFSLVGKILETPAIEKPEDIWVQNIKWDKTEYAEKYTYVLQRKDENDKWQKVEMKENYAGNEVPLDVKYPGGQYRFAIKAESHLREPSKVARIDFQVYNGDRSPAAVEEAKLRYSLEKPTPWYFVASYLITQVNYSGINSERGNGSTVSYNALGGTGRLGIGYINPKSNRGHLGIIDLSGFTIDGQNVTYASAEQHYLWRYTWGRNMFRPSAGLFFKELVEAKDLITSPGKYQMEKLSYAGPHGGFDFWRPLTPKLGFQLNARFYYGLMGMSTPNGLDQTPNLSYQMGFMGSYKLKTHITGFMGWAYRVDRASYKSSPFDGTTSFATGAASQTIQIEGNFFNLLLEWGF